MRNIHFKILSFIFLTLFLATSVNTAKAFFTFEDVVSNIQLLPSINLSPHTDTGATFETMKTSAIPEAGDVKNIISKTEPKITLEKWNGETSMGVKYDGMSGPGDKALFSENVEWIGDQEKMEAVPLEASSTMEDGGVEINIILKSKPAKNVFNFTISGAENLDFFYQPTLWQEEGLKAPTKDCTDTDCIGQDHRTLHRPHNVVGSYAVYYKTHRDHEVGQRNYATGKAYHIYRPLVTDAHGNKIWADLSYSNGILTVTVPQSFLDSATYPVIVDPTFGYTTLGGTADTGNKTSNGSANGHGSLNQYTATAGDIITSFSVGAACTSSCSGGSVDMAAYTSVSNHPAERLAASTTISVTSTTGQFWTSGAVSQAMIGGTVYVSAVGGYGNGSNGMTLYFDAGAANGVSARATAQLVQTWTEVANAARNYSWYTTYTAGTTVTRATGHATSTVLYIRPALAVGLVGFWTLNGKDMLTNVADQSGLGNKGYLINQPSTTTAPGKIGQGLSIDGTNDYVKIPTNSGLDLTTALTVAAWIKSNTNSPTDKGIVAKWSGNGYMLYLSSGKVQGYVRSVNSNSNTTISADGWYHIAYTWDGATIKTYVNGVADGANVAATLSATDVSDLQIGTYNTRTQSTFNGIIDEARVYNRALSASEIFQLSQISRAKTSLSSKNSMTTGLAGYWTFDGADMLRNVADMSGNSNNGSIIGQSSTTTVPGKLGQALNFDGVDDYISLPTLSPSPFWAARGRTISAWIKPNSGALTGHSTIVTGYSDTTEFSRLNLDLSSGHPHFDFSVYPGPTAVDIYASSITPIAGNWYHITVSWDDTTYTLYWNGSSVGTYVHSGVTTDNVLITTIGANIDSGNLYYFNGSLDDVRVYNRALSAAEISTIYNLGRTKLK